MKIWIKDTDKYPMWAIPDLGLFFSFIENEHKEVAVSNLTKDQQKTIWVDIQLGKLETDNFEELRSAMFPTPAPRKEAEVIVLDTVPESRETMSVEVMNFDSETKTVDIVLSDTPPVSLPPRVEIRDRSDELKTLLEKSVATLKRELPGIRNTADWKKLLEIEISNKNRKTVIALLNELMTNFNNQVSASILKETPVVPGLKNIGSIYNKKEQLLLKNIDDIMESEQEIIEIKLE